VDLKAPLKDTLCDVADRERFIPTRVSRLIADLRELPWSGGEVEAEGFGSFGRLVAALYHYDFHDREQAIADAWERAGYDTAAASELVAELTGLLDGANYTPVTAAELGDALTNESLIPLRLEVDFDDYDEMLIYRRGSKRTDVEIPKWMGLKSEQRTITVDERVVVYTKVKPRHWFDELEIDPADRNLIPGHVSLKQFQNVPRADIEMLLPSTQVGFRLIDSLLVGVPAVASGIAVLATKLLPTLGLMFLLAGAWLGVRDESPDIDQAALVILFGGLLTIGGFVFRQWTKLKNRRIDYLKTLTENLYLRTLGAGPGVFHTLLSSAEHQEVAEVLLAYRLLLAEPSGLTTQELDTRVEAWLRETGCGDIDFEVDDALAKLRRLEVVVGRSTIKAVSLPESLAHVFQYQPSDLEPRLGRPHDRDGAGHPRAPGLVRLLRVVDRFRGRLGDRRTERHGEDPGPQEPE